MREKDHMVKSEQLYLFKLDYWWCVRFTMIFPLSGWKPKEQDLSKSSVSSKPFEEKWKISPLLQLNVVWFSLPFHCALGRRRGRVEWRALSPFPPQLSSVVFSFSWSTAHCAQLHTFLSLGYSVLSVAGGTLPSVSVAPLAKPPAFSGLWPSTILQPVGFILPVIGCCVPALFGRL